MTSLARFAIPRRRACFVLTQWRSSVNISFSFCPSCGESLKSIYYDEDYSSREENFGRETGAVHSSISRKRASSSPLARPGAIIEDGDRKSWDPRGPMIWDNVSIFRTNWAILTSYIHARVVVSRVDDVTLRDQLLRIARFSCGFFTAMAGNKEPGIFYVLLCS